jgi:hypothetical protein
MIFFYNTLCPPGKRTKTYIALSTIADALRAKRTKTYIALSTIPYALRAIEKHDRFFPHASGHNNRTYLLCLLPQSG